MTEANRDTRQSLDEQPSTYSTEAGSNFVAAERYAQQMSQGGGIEQQPFGQPVHASDPSLPHLDERFQGPFPLEQEPHEHGHHESTYRTEGGSNILCAKRDAEQRGGGGGPGGGTSQEPTHASTNIADRPPWHS